MKKISYILAISATVMLSSCQDMHIDEPLIQERPLAVSNRIAGYVSVENSRLYGKAAREALPPMATRALIDMVTTRRMDSNFLRIDEDINRDNADSPGLYTFTGNDSEYVAAYGSSGVNWMKSYLTEAIVVSSPDNTTPDSSLPEGMQGGHFRSVSLDPIQTYNILVQPRDENGTEVPDTTQFYHTRMVGWYPRNCNIPRDAEGKAAHTLFDNSKFEGRRIRDKVTVDGHERDVVSVQFTGLDGTVDLMVSNVCEGQHWHNPADWYGHPGQTPPSDIHPESGNDIYRKPFGFNSYAPAYSNFFTYRHYLSAVRVYVRANLSEQALQMWGDIEELKILNQPTSVKVWLPEQISEFGEAYDWEDKKNIDINPGPLFGDDSNHPEESKEKAEYPIDLGNSHSLEKIYLGNALIQPDSPVTLELHTTSGVYQMDLSEKITKDDGSVTDLFRAGFIYDIVIDLGTDGKIAAIIDDDASHRYYDLTALTELNPDGVETDLYTYRYANCYVIETSDERRVKVYDDKDDDSKDVEYHGYAFAAHIIGNGQAGILSSGAQTMYPTSAAIKPTYASLIWTDNKDLISNVELVYDYVRFCVHNPKDKKGNAVIAVFDNNDKILWSWHIWITPELNEQSFDTGVENVNMSTVITMLDRNLGATESRWTGADDVLETYGLYYQWGRKDPSPGPPSWDYSIRSLSTATYYDYALQPYNAAEVVSKPAPTLRDGVENPLYLIMPTSQTQSYYFNWTNERYDFLWGFSGTDDPVHKTIYDPCPFGYRVPTSALTSLAYDAYHAGQASYISLTEYGQIISHPNPTTAEGGYEDVTDGKFYFPYTGYKGVDRTMNSYMLAWKYVGEKADYQDATIDLAPGTAETPNPDYLARGRLYLSKEQNWSETSVGSYSGYYVTDFANRRTAAPVRCVKDVDMAVIVASISTSTPYVSRPAEGTDASLYPFVRLECSAVSYSSDINRLRLVAVYYEYDEEGKVTATHSEVLKDIREDIGGTWYNNQKDFQIKPVWISKSPAVTFDLYATNDMGVIAQNSVTINVIEYDLNTDWWRDRPTYPETEALNNTDQLRGETTRRAVIYNGSIDPQHISNVQFRKVSRNGVAVSGDWHNGGDPYEIPTTAGAKYEHSAYLYYEFMEKEAGTYEYEMRFDIMGSTQSTVKLPPFNVADWKMDIVWDTASGDERLWWKSTFGDEAGLEPIRLDGVPVSYQMAGATVTRKVKLTNFEYIYNREEANLTLTAYMGTTPLTVTRDEVSTLEATDAIFYNVTFSKNEPGIFSDITLTATYLGNVGDTETPPYTVAGISFDDSMWETAYTDADCTNEAIHLSNTRVYRKLRIYGDVDSGLIEGLAASHDTDMFSAVVLEDMSVAGKTDRTYAIELNGLASGTHDVTATVNWAEAVGGGGQDTVLYTAVSDITIDTSDWDNVYGSTDVTGSYYPFQLAGNTVYRKFTISSSSITTSEAGIGAVEIVDEYGKEAGVVERVATTEPGLALEQVYRVRLNSPKGNHNYMIIVNWAGGRKTADVLTPVYGPGNKATSLSAAAGSYYVIENNSYKGYYLEATRAGGNLSASQSVSYNSVFKLSNATNGTLYNVGTSEYVRGTSNNSDLTLSTSSGTSYRFNSQTGGSFSIRYNYYYRYWNQQSQYDNVQLSSSASYYNFYLLTTE